MDDNTEPPELLRLLVLLKSDKLDTNRVHRISEELLSTRSMPELTEALESLNIFSTSPLRAADDLDASLKTTPRIKWAVNTTQTWLRKFGRCAEAHLDTEPCLLSQLTPSELHERLVDHVKKINAKNEPEQMAYKEPGKEPRRTQSMSWEQQVVDHGMRDESAARNADQQVQQGEHAFRRPSRTLLYVDVQPEPTAQPSSEQINPSLPRTSLVHELQHERGCSCALVASGGALEEFHGLVRLHRHETDSLMPSSPKSDLMLRKPLDRLRAAVDEVATGVNSDPPTLAVAFYRTFTDYTDVITRVRDDTALTYSSRKNRPEKELRAALAFSGLTELMSRERAFICGHLSLPDDALGYLPTRAFADFVVSITQQRQQMKSINATAPQQLLHLLTAGFKLNSKLMLYQNKLLENFDVLALKREGLTAWSWWHLMTSQIQRMHSLENLYFQELRTLRQQPKTYVPIDLSQLNEAGSPAFSHASDMRGSPNLGLRKLRCEADCDSVSNDSACSGLRTLVPLGSWGRDRRERPTDCPSPSASGSVESAKVSPHKTPDILPAQDTRDRFSKLSHPKTPATSDTREGVQTPYEQNLAALSGFDASVVKRAVLDVMGQDYNSELLKTLLKHCDMLTHQPQLCAEHASINGTERAADGESFRIPVAFCSETAVEAADEMMIPLESLVLLQRIGSGAFSTTYEARWKHGNPTSSMSASGAEVNVAVKVASDVGDSVSQWRAEVKALTRLDHPNVVKYLGYVASPPTNCLVLELCRAGDLYNRLKEPTPKGFVLRIASGIASGLAYIHSLQIIHRDIKSANILLDNDSVPKLTDFGVAADLPDRTAASQAAGLTAETGTYRWMAPEVLRHEPYSESADVFSFAMVLYELITHHVPFVGMEPIQVAVCTALENRRPPLPPGIPEPLKAILALAWSMHRAERQRASELKMELESLARTLTADQCTWLDAENGNSAVSSLPPLA
eukprot:CAMPEP_0119311682 /NCGR_PEP_ID=MMETSP1333-20130426/23401_1 /TAXON_ID=418940 /ORGANISM="Scyphosphaera apsteinii, Strain RCC1455" /LENGTH=968 /DNA_ID=CAMNT_0007316123 /DNA_START=122 /DNA_END=3028 /DNA_ORIENTATION=-